MEQTYRGTVSGRTIQLDDEVKLPVGTEVVVTVRTARTGSSAALLAAVDAEPHIPREDAEELLRLIREG